MRNPKKGIVEKTGYIYHSMWLNQYMFFYYVYFFLLALDTFIAHNLTQFVVLSNLFFFLLTIVFMIGIMFLWALDSSRKNAVIKFAVIWSQRLYILQLFMLALTQIPYVYNLIFANKVVFSIFFTTGMVVNG